MKRRGAALALTVLLLALLCACGGTAQGETSADTAAGMEEGGYGFVSNNSAASQETPSVAQPSDKNMARSEKVIYTANMSMETTAFDEAARGLEDLVAACGGYVESSSVSSRGDGYRYADYTVRVPAEQFEHFRTQAGELCHVTWQDKSQQDVSYAYYDTAGRLKTQQTKLERLQALLAKAESMEDIITIESAISDTEYQIESLSGELRYYDAQVDHSTVYISLSEVYKLSNVEDPATGFASRVGTALVSGWKGFVNFLESLAVTLAYGWVFVLILAAAAVVVIRRLRRKSGEKISKKTDDRGPM